MKQGLGERLGAIHDPLVWIWDLWRFSFAFFVRFNWYFVSDCL